MNANGDMEHFILDYTSILAFTTGASYPPPIGFSKKTTIAFQYNSPFPRSNTCANTLYLPAAHPLPSLEQFVYNIAFGILNAAGFGCV